MDFKIFVIALFYHVVISEQRSVQRIALDHKQIDELQDLLKQLELQINKDHNVHKHSEKSKHKGIIEGNDVLDMLLERDDNKDRSDEGVLKIFDRVCKAGRCGCSGERCGYDRAESSSDEVTKLLDSLEITIDKDMEHSHTRCGHGRCGKNREGDLRCGGRGRCGGNKADLDDRDDLNLRVNPDIKHQLGQYGKTYQLNNELNAVVLNTARVNDALNELKKYCQNANCKFIDYGKTRTTPDVDTEEDSINAIILDLTHVSDSKNLVKDLNNALVKAIKSSDSQKEYFSPDDLDKYYQDYKKTAINDVVGYIKDKNGRRESIYNLTTKQKQLVENVKSLLVKSGIGLKDKQVVKQIEEILFGKHSSTKIFAHGEQNRNIYVPKRLYNKIGKPKREVNLRVQKRLLPLTLKQRNRLQKKPVHLWRRNSSLNYGLPFDLQVQGLGQVLP